MGRNRRWVLEDSILDAVWKTILRGPRPPSVKWEKQRSGSAVANTANLRKDSKKETKSKDSAKIPKVVQVQPRSNRQSPLETHAAAQAKVQAALSVLGRCRCGREGEPGTGPLARTDASRGATHVGTDHFHERIHRPGEETVGCRRGGSSRSCPQPRRVHQSFGRGKRRLEELQLQEKSFVAPVPDAELIRFRAQVAELQGSVKVF